MSGGKRIRPVHPLIEFIMIRNGYIGAPGDDINLTQLARKTGSSQQFLSKLFEPSKIEGYLEKTERWASSVGISSEEWLEAMLLYLKHVQDESKERVS